MTVAMVIETCELLLTNQIQLQGPQKVKFGGVGLSDNVITAKDIIIATGSVPFVPKGIEVDGTYSSLPVLPTPC